MKCCRSLLGLSAFALTGMFTTQVLAAAPLPNAWQITDNSGGANTTLRYQTNLTLTQQNAATNLTGGFRYTVTARFLTDFGDDASMAMVYGLGARRFLIWWELDGSGNLIANLDGAGIVILPGTTNYHTHEILYDPISGTASYLVDGEAKTNNWSPSSNMFTAGLVAWGASSSSGQGQMNFHAIAFAIPGLNTVSYHAGYQGNPATARNPTTVGWTLSQGVGGGTSTAAISPDSVMVTLVTTAPADAFTPGGARLNGQANPYGTPALGWFEWGTNTSYGNVTAPQPLGSGTIPLNFSNTIGGLTIGATYHFRAVLSNAFETAVGTNRSFNLDIAFFPSVIPGLPGVDNGSVAWADYDNDGRLDFLLTGRSGVDTVSELWHNTSTGFVKVPIAGLPGVANGSVAWADYDNDGRADFLLTGYNNSSGLGISQLWRNTSTGFVNVPIPGLPGVEDSSVAWADYDNDGRTDFLLIGYSGSLGLDISQLWRNTGNGFVNAPIAGLPGVEDGSIAWTDYDNDGRTDFLLTGFSDSLGDPVSQLWRNTSTGFVNIPIADLPGVYDSEVAWADYDNDGRIDFLLTGYGNGQPISQLWRNTGSGFVNIPVAGLPPVSQGAVAWADYDNDGRLDFLLTGYNNSSGLDISQLWHNTGSGFVNKPVAGLPPVSQGAVAWADYDNDGRTDFLLTGSSGSQLWHNLSTATNAAPGMPGTLTMTPSGSEALLNWTAATDAQTPSAGLTYNLRVGTAPGAGDIVSPLALGSGFRLVPQQGNVGRRLTTRIPVRFGQTHYWSVQAIDNAHAGGPFAAEQSFTMNSVLTPPNGIPVPGDLNGNGVVELNEFNSVLANYNNGVVDQSALDDVLERYWPSSPWLYLTNVAGLGGTRVTFALTNSTAGAFSVEYTTNLSNWIFLGPATPRYEFTDTNALASPQRSYRLRWP